MTTRKKETRLNAARLLSWIKSRGIIELILLSVILWAVCVVLYRATILPVLCRNGVMTTAYTYEWSVSGKGVERIKYFYQVNGVEYRGRGGGWVDSLEVCYLPSCPRIHLEGISVRRSLNIFHLKNRTFSETTME